MVGLILEQLENLGDEVIVLQWKCSSYYQVFCGMKEFQCRQFYYSIELVHFRKLLGKEEGAGIFCISIALHGESWRWKIVMEITGLS